MLLYLMKAFVSTAIELFLIEIWEWETELCFLSARSLSDLYLYEELLLSVCKNLIERYYSTAVEDVQRVVVVELELYIYSCNV